MNSDDLINKQSQFVLDAYSYALDHKLDITNTDDISSILNTLDPKHEIRMNTEQLMQALVVLDKKIRSDLAERNRIN